MTPEHNTAFCPYYHRAMELIGRRWTGAFLRALRAGVCRFSDLRSTIPDLSDRMLSERLKELEKEGLVERTVIPETPVRVEYRLTARGEALGSVLDAVTNWAHTWLGDQEPGPPQEAPAPDMGAVPPRRVGRRRVSRAG